MDTFIAHMFYNLESRHVLQCLSAVIHMLLLHAVPCFLPNDVASFHMRTIILADICNCCGLIVQYAEIYAWHIWYQHLRDPSTQLQFGDIDHT